MYYDIEKSNLTLLFIAGFKDELNDSAVKSLKKIQNFGIKVIIASGEHKCTIQAASRELGILVENEKNATLSGSEFSRFAGEIICKLCSRTECDCPKNEIESDLQYREMREDILSNFEEFEKSFDKFSILSRANPSHIKSLLTGLKQKGMSVAAIFKDPEEYSLLSKADISFALMGKTCQILKNHCDILLVDNQISSIISTIIWGKNIYNSVRKFLQFQITIVSVILVLNFICALFIKQSPLEPIQLLWVDLIVDSFAVLALCAEPTDSSVAKTKLNKDESLLNDVNWVHLEND